MEEENNWKVSKQNKKSGKKRFLRQFIVFLVSILIIALIVIGGIFIYNNKSSNINEDKAIPENKVEETNTTEESVVKKASLDNKVYSIENKDFYFDGEAKGELSGIKLYEYDNTKAEYAEIYFCLYSYSTDPSYSYVLEAKSEGGESLLLNERSNSISEREIMGGITSSIKIDKEKVGSKIDITIKEMYEHSARSRTIERQAKVTIDLTKDLEEQKKVDFESNTAKYELEDMEFETYKDDSVSKDTYAMHSPNCKSVSYSIGISTQYGNKILSEEHIEFSVLNNINNLSLDEAFDIESQITEKIGQYGLADQYKIFTSNGSGDVTNEFEVTFEDMKKLINGEEVDVDGKKITSQDIANEEENLKIAKSSKVTIANGINAIKYNYKTETDRTNYMFILNGNIYYIHVPNGERYETNVNLFLNSLTKK